ncbi:4-alpha-glucanotransferase [Endozoicomonas gorgoniicola]|uniref:4-alpha-glucanotransferase n=1 Tax=Endozoicomonas gorgoniicola TaxID=1234144 RepID=A0ABT3MXY2_9GAMM|nr:4-alpha-glucanotransferase [Endozoicomonas gorgoniicola]MCW7554239.1 4-alpha-glucanotransferase [Endozoicomonas gorgoniicola]
MTISTSLDQPLVEQLAALSGVCGNYEDWAGRPVSVPTELKIPILQAMGFNLSNNDNTRAAIDHCQQQQWEHLVAPVNVVHQGQPFTIDMYIPESRLSNAFKGEFELESGRRRSISVKADSLEIIDRQSFPDRDLVKLSLELPEDLPTGYHRLTLKNRNLEAISLIIVAPATCYEPESLKQGHKIWGSAIQLYTLRTEHDWGIGDFSSLKQLAEKLASQGAHIVGLNPIHALYPANPLHASPYSPSSRNFINPLYLDVTAIPEFADSTEARAMVNDPGFQGAIADARKAEYVDYVQVASLKFKVLALLFKEFQHNHVKTGTPRGKAFLNFCDIRGASLDRHATYEALYAHFRQLDIMSWGWPCWPDDYQTPDSDAVKGFSEQNRDAIDYYKYLQWLSEIQLAEAQKSALDAGMQVGIYRDLAVGVDRGGADVWSNRAVYCLDASVGAPPDGVAPQGQNWGLPPFNPVTLKQQHYAPFIEMVRSNMSHCGALRIDHVMGLLRLWWCPNGKTADFGAYTYYPLNDLLGIIKLESQRRECLVFGEDLGTIPPEIEASLPPARCYSNEVVLFSCEGDRFMSPGEFRPMALTCISNHDVPTLKAWWNCLDLDLRHELGIYNAEKTEAQKLARHQDKMALVHTLIDINERPRGMNPDHISTLGYTRDVMEKLHYYLAKTTSKIVVLQLEDVLQIESPVNVPGTSSEYPNWQRKLTETLESLFADESNQALFKNICNIRQA